MVPDLSYLLDLDPARLAPRPGEPTMKAVVTTGNGGTDRLAYRDVAVPEPAPGEVLLRVLAAGVNNTEINTRLGWYASAVSGGTGALAQTSVSDVEDGGWDRRTPFPFIQGTDCCGVVVARADGVARPALGARVLVRACMRTHGFGSLDNVWMGSDFDGAFAQYVRVPAGEAFEVDCGWSDVELATLPCASGTAENLIHRSGVGPADRVLVTGASGGVGSAAVQLAKRRGAHVTAVVGRAKAEAVRALGVDRIVPRGQDLVDALGESSVDVVIDIVAGDGFGRLLKVMARGGRYATSGAIAGPIVTMDLRDLYLKDQRLIGATAWDEPVFPNLVGYVERGEIRPLVAGTFPLADIAEAQRVFGEKKHVGNYVLIPPEA
jgi:NADPH:quinone reductase-like Zn-dependent oxidoreductase